jgi:hypothetical protein
MLCGGFCDIPCIGGTLPSVGGAGSAGSTLSLSPIEAMLALYFFRFVWRGGRLLPMWDIKMLCVRSPD